MESNLFKGKIMKLTLIFIVFSFFVYAGEERSFCDPVEMRVGKSFIYTGELANGKCYLSLSPRNTQDLIYRDYLFVSDGTMMVFNSFGYGPISTHTGSRVFYFLPKVKEMSFSVSGDFITLNFINSSSLKIDANTLTPLSFTGGSFVFNPEINHNNGGGLDFYPNKDSYILDFPFKLGGDPRRSYKRDTYLFHNNKKCKLSNSDILLYQGDDFDLRHTKKAELEKLISSLCVK